MKEKGMLCSQKMVQHLYELLAEPIEIREAVQRQSRILDAD